MNYGPQHCAPIFSHSAPRRAATRATENAICPWIQPSFVPLNESLGPNSSVPSPHFGERGHVIRNGTLRLGFFSPNDPGSRPSREMCDPNVLAPRLPPCEDELHNDR